MRLSTTGLPPVCATGSLGPALCPRRHAAGRGREKGGTRGREKRGEEIAEGHRLSVQVCPREKLQRDNWAMGARVESKGSRVRETRGLLRLRRYSAAALAASERQIRLGGRPFA